MPVKESECVKLAFSGIHIMSDKVFDLMEDYPERFPIMDFYLDQCLEHDIYGVKAEDLNLIDVGKLDTLQTAEKFIKQ